MSNTDIAIKALVKIANRDPALRKATAIFKCSNALKDRVIKIKEAGYFTPGDYAAMAVPFRVIFGVRFPGASAIGALYEAYKQPSVGTFLQVAAAFIPAAAVVQQAWSLIKSVASYFFDRATETDALLIAIDSPADVIYRPYGYYHTSEFVLQPLPADLYPEAHLLDVNLYPLASMLFTAIKRPANVEKVYGYHIDIYDEWTASEFMAVRESFSRVAYDRQPQGFSARTLKEIDDKLRIARSGQRKMLQPAGNPFSILQGVAGWTPVLYKEVGSTSVDSAYVVFDSATNDSDHDIEDCVDATLIHELDLRYVDLWYRKVAEALPSIARPPDDSPDRQPLPPPLVSSALGAVRPNPYLPQYYSPVLLAKLGMFNK